MQEIISYLANYSNFQLYGILFVLAWIVSLGFAPFNMDLVVLSTGVLIGAEILIFQFAFPTVLIALLIGESIVFFAGKKIGDRVLDMKFIRKILPKEKQLKGAEYIDENTFQSCVLLRFFPVYKATMLFTFSGLALKKAHYFNYFIPLTFFYVAIYQAVPWFLTKFFDLDYYWFTVILFGLIFCSVLSRKIAVSYWERQLIYKVNQTKDWK